MGLFSRADLEALSHYDTPTVCNGLELLMPERRSSGFTVEPLIAADPNLSPIVGLARVGTIRAYEPPRGKVLDRAEWYDYVASADLPTVVVLQDLDDRPGFGAFWGEVNSAIHKALGVLGAVTNGSFRDLGGLAPGFQILGGSIGPSHAFVHVVGFGNAVTVGGMQVEHDDVIHADRHGAVVIPPQAICELPAAIARVARRERLILDACGKPGFSTPALRELLARAAEIR